MRSRFSPASGWPAPCARDQLPRRAVRTALPLGVCRKHTSICPVVQHYLHVLPPPTRRHAGFHAKRPFGGISYDLVLPPFNPGGNGKCDRIGRTKSGTQSILPWHASLKLARQEARAPGDSFRQGRRSFRCRGKSIHLRIRHHLVHFLLLRLSGTHKFVATVVSSGTDETPMITSSDHPFIFNLQACSD